MVRVLIEEMEKYAEKNRVPIMLPSGIAFLENYIREHHVKNILEIGSAIGYSAIRMASLDSSIRVVTLERDEVRYLEAVSNIKKALMQNQIEIHHIDAFDFNTEEKFDLIFIDAAKGQYIKFFEKFKSNLQDDGTIISDNLDFHGYTKSEERIESKNLRQLVKKIKDYISFLEQNEEFTTEFLTIGDGIGVSKKKENIDEIG